ncbi:MAG: hypothetical protein H2057_04320 [Alphaproteobacteria bacterium]|nr:hypothetical protein [Alphaproteobacteria bacterium]
MLCFSQVNLAYGSQDASLSSYVTHYEQKTHYSRPSTADLDTARALFLKILRNERCDDDQKVWHRLGFSQTYSSDNTYTIIEELPKSRTGKGVYFIRKHSIHDVLVQAPHYPSDLLTGDLASLFFHEFCVKAAAWSTTHRKVVDLAHEDCSFFNAFSEAFAQYNQHSVILQLHAFSQKKHHTDADLIMSSALETPPTFFINRYLSLKEFFKEKHCINAYPKDVSFLGGTKNTNAHAYYRAGGQSFLHLEMSKKFRTDLLNHEKSRSDFFHTIIKTKD